MTDQSPDSMSPVSLDEFREFQRSTVQNSEFTDEDMSMIEERITALEEIVAARGPRAWLVRRRLARELRVTNRAYKWVGPGFRERRQEAASDVYRLTPAERRKLRPLTPAEVTERLQEATRRPAE